MECHWKGPNVCPQVGGTYTQQTSLCQWNPIPDSPEVMAPLPEIPCQVPWTLPGQRRGHTFPGRIWSSLGSCSQELMPGWCRVCWRRVMVGAVVLGRAVGVTGATLPTSTAHCHLGAILTVFPAVKISKVWTGERKGYVFSLILVLFFSSTP